MQYFNTSLWGRRESAVPFCVSYVAFHFSKKLAQGQRFFCVDDLPRLLIDFHILVGLLQIYALAAAGKVQRDAVQRAACGLRVRLRLAVRVDPPQVIENRPDLGGGVVLIIAVVVLHGDFYHHVGGVGGGLQGAAAAGQQRKCKQKGK